MCTLCSKKCKSLGGLKRHMTCKHKDELGDKETECIEGEQCKFTADLLAKMVDEGKQRIVNNKVFSKTIREELLTYSFSNLAEGIAVVLPDVQFARSRFARTESRFARSMKSFRPDRESIHLLYIFYCVAVREIFLQTVNRFAMIDHYLYEFEAAILIHP